MAQNIKKDTKPANIEKPSGNVSKIVAVLLVLVMLGGAGFALGIYLKFIDIQDIGDKWKLYDKPVIGKYFERPKTNFETVDIDDTKTNTDKPQVNKSPQEVLPQAQSQINSISKLDTTERDKLAKEKQQEEAKKISKLARLYSSMKPTEAANILNQLDDPTVLAILNKMEEDQAAKILSSLDSKRSARLTELILKGQAVSN
ncbi:MotE family protein [Dendrosporobacter sp. 1207_IL3150]|uniref:MotE family protein n=1 Tax=Dendrosporobacter sp. 1207_IL3150 TaxID=3084054 RepID=UPI002FDA3F08